MGVLAGSAWANDARIIVAIDIVVVTGVYDGSADRSRWWRRGLPSACTWGTIFADAATGASSVVPRMASLCGVRRRAA